MSFIPRIRPLGSGVDYNRAKALTGLWNEYQQYQERGAPVQPPASEQAAPVPHTRQIVNPSGGSLAYLLRKWYLNGTNSASRPASVGRKSPSKVTRQIPRLSSPEQDSDRNPVRIDWENERSRAAAAAAANPAAAAHINARLRTFGWLVRTMETSGN
jgi:hypothetical protein